MTKNKFWLFKTEPSTFSIDDFANEKNETTMWDGVRNYQARNCLRDDLKIGDQVLIYHSNAKPAGVAGIAEVVHEAYPDFTAFDNRHKHYDAKSNPESPRWYMVDVRFIEKFPRLVSLDEIKTVTALNNMVLVKNSRLSVQPVTKQEFDAIKKLAKKQA